MKTPDITDEFWKSFDDPRRAYYNYFPLIQYYKDNTEVTKPNDTDHASRAWEEARKPTSASK